MEARTNIKAPYSVERIYIRNLQFTPGDMPALFELKWQPQVKLEIEVSHRKLTDIRFEVCMKLQLKAELGSRLACDILLEQAGIFVIPESPDRDKILTLECPNLLFPYAREAIDNIAVRATFPAFAIAPVNLERLIKHAFEQKQMEIKKQKPFDEVLN